MYKYHVVMSIVWLLLAVLQFVLFFINLNEGNAIAILNAIMVLLAIWWHRIDMREAAKIREGK